MAERNDELLAFETLVADILEQYVAVVERPVRGLGRVGYDFRVRSDARDALVEVKAYSTFRIAHNVVRQSFLRLREAMAQHDVSVGIFATNAKLPPALKKEAKDANIVIYDFDVLQILTSGHPVLAERLSRFLQEELIYRSEPLPDYDPTVYVGFITSPPAPPTSPPTRVPTQSDRGRDLCAALKATVAGRKGKAASTFEKACTEALRYLFDEEFIGWQTQKRSHGALHRYDLIARINSENDFWNLMITDHRSRYIIFEFKNHPGKISQVEIYSTEKYLLPSAMRSTGIIISRKGFDANAFRVSAAALREGAKLILGLSIEELCEMLHLKDDGGDPAQVVARKLDELLTGLER